MNENVKELVEAAKLLLQQIYPSSDAEFDYEKLDKACERTLKAIRALEAQEGNEDLDATL